HVFDACPVVPAPVENHDLAGCRGVLEVALHVELGLLAIGRCRQSYLAKHAMADTLGNRLDHPALAGGVAPFEDHDYPRTLFLDPILQRAQLHLQLAQRLFVLLTFQATIVSCHQFCTLTPVENLPWPLFSKEGLNFYEENSPFEKGDRGGFIHFLKLPSASRPGLHRGYGAS